MSAALEVVQDTERAQALLHRARLELLEHLAEPSSAAALGRRLGLPRQRVNYHLRELLAKGLVELVGESRKGSCVERQYRRTGAGYAISPAALGPLAVSPEDVQDRFSAAFQIALASRAVQELAALEAGARAAGKRLATLTLESEVRFATPEARHAFSEELASALAALVRKYHDGSAEGGRSFRLWAGAYPLPRGRAEGGEARD